jgi:16S rRNA (adenine1518-N6/adenine1519-N6)-dimethyltransferase
VLAGENYDAAARRELQEELGVSVPVRMVAKLDASENTGYEFICLYQATHEGPFTLPAVEIEAGEFFPQTLISDWIAARRHEFAPGFIECWQVFRGRSV